MIEDLVKSFFREGSVLVRLPDGRELKGGEGEPEVVLRITDWGAAMRIARRPHLYLGEAYMNGTLVMERGSIYDLMDAITRNFKYARKVRPFLRFLKRVIVSRWVQANARLAARRNVAHHYDLSLDLYRRFLDSDLQYSCAYFPYPGASLEEAQIAKKRHIAAKLLLKPGVRVLDIGCGWGGLGLSLAEAGAEVTGVTLSVEQLNTARARAAAKGMSEHAHFELEDYRDTPGSFDRVVSVGMFEHVGRPNYQRYFNSVARLLNEDGVALIHTIGRSDGPDLTSAWIAKYIFPGGYIPALSEIVPAVERAGLVITDIEVLRLHYADTLRAWAERFASQRDEIRALYDERFCRMWEFYLAGSEAAFRAGASVVFQLQLAKRSLSVPITRDYISDYDRLPLRAPAAGGQSTQRL